MTNRSSTSLGGMAGMEKVAWTPYPGVMTTLLAGIGVITLFLGLSTITNTIWFTWIGLGLMGFIVGAHLWRYWQARRNRVLAREQLHATLISQCRSSEESSFLKRHHIGTEPLILVLTEDSLHVGHRDPLDIFATVPLYNVEKVALNGNSTNPTLKLEVRTNGERVHTLAFNDFESNAPARAWAEALEHKQG
jgi:hypothetical protein